MRGDRPVYVHFADDKLKQAFAGATDPYLLREGVVHPSGMWSAGQRTK